MSGRSSSTDSALPLWYAYVELTSRYVEALDLDAGVGIGELFEADGTWDGTDFGLPVLSGRDAIELHFAGSGDPPASVHLVHNHRIIEVSDTGAVARSYCHAMQTRPDRVRHLIVRYEDVVGFGDGWQFKSRVLYRGPAF